MMIEIICATHNYRLCITPSPCSGHIKCGYTKGVDLYLFVGYTIGMDLYFVTA
jgi:hypothetical protein